MSDPDESGKSNGESTPLPEDPEPANKSASLQLNFPDREVWEIAGYLRVGCSRSRRCYFGGDRRSIEYYARARAADRKKGIVKTASQEAHTAHCRMKRVLANARPITRSFYTSRLPLIALISVTSSAYSRSAPWGSPRARRVTRTARDLSSLER